MIPAPISDPDFFTAFAARKYRLDGLVLSRPQSQPTIHVLEEVRKPMGRIILVRTRTALGLCRKGETMASIARKLVMQTAIFWR